MRLLVVQYAGDYRATFRALAAGGDETYFAQRYSDDAIAAYAARGDVVVVALMTPEAYDERLPNGVRAVGFGPQGHLSEDAVVALAAELEPTHLLLRAPMVGLLRWGIAARCDMALTLADSFNGTGLRSWWRHRRLSRLLNHPQVRWIGNHGVSSSQGLVSIGVSAAKVVPWDWPHDRSPDPIEPKAAPAPGSPWRLLFVGAVSELKGVGDLLRGAAELVRSGRAVDVSIVGSGELEQFQALAAALGITEQVTFVGRVPNKAVVALMREADLVVVPSRTDYPEGFPLTIYEALSARTPIVASDHPMFRQHLRDGDTAAVFPSGDASKLAGAVTRLMDTPALYEQLSIRSAATWHSLQIPVKWADFISAWIDGGDGEALLRTNSLAASANRR